MTFYFRNVYFLEIRICDFSELCNYQVIEPKATTDVSWIYTLLIKKCLRELMICQIIVVALKERASYQPLYLKLE